MKLDGVLPDEDVLEVLCHKLFREFGLIRILVYSRSSSLI